MSRMKRAAMVVGLVTFGYLLGGNGVLAPNASKAQAGKVDLGVSDEAAAKIKSANETLQAAMAALQTDQKYIPATTGVNSFAILSGGLNAIDDLDNNRGVDPETFAGLYAGLADDSIKSKLGTDAEGRMTYDGKVIRIYPISRLKKLYEKRDQLIGIKAKKPAN